MFRYLIAFSCLLLLSACFMHKNAGKAKPHQASLEYGMTREEALALIKDRSELVVGEFNLPQGHVVAYQYSRYGKAGYKTAKYILYFINDTLIRKAPEENLLKGAKTGVREYYSRETE